MNSFISSGREIFMVVMAGPPSWNPTMDGKFCQAKFDCVHGHRPRPRAPRPGHSPPSMACPSFERPDVSAVRFRLRELPAMKVYPVRQGHSADSSLGEYVLLYFSLYLS